MKRIIYYNGTILTIDNKSSIFEALLIEDGVIKELGSSNEILKLKDSSTDLVDLKGKTLMPSFIDSHSHITSYAQTLRLVNLGNCTSFEDIFNTLKNFIDKNNLKEDEWITGFNYDHERLKEKEHPTKLLLDKLSKTNPIILSHISGHMGVINSIGLNLFNITKDSINPDGGEIIKFKDSNEPTGLLKENAFIQNTFKIPVPSVSDLSDLLVKAQEDYLKFGITTCQDGFTKKEEFAILDYSSKNKKLKMDIVGFIDIKNNKNIYEENKETYVKGYINNFRIGGYKMFLDGSPQGRTAWMLTPYKDINNPDKNSKEFGIGTLTDDEVLKFIGQALNDNAQILSHCNGDAAAKQLIDSFKKVLNERNESFTSTLPVMVHAQLVRDSQLKDMKEIGMIPSFFTAHSYFWGDIHIKNFGLERASKISPAKSALNRNLVFTFHQDTPVLMPDMFRTIWCSVNRITLNGVTIGEDEKISVLDAIKAVTINAAKQYFEDDKKGSLEKGKLADIIIIDKNPLEINPLDLYKIKVLETIKSGEVLYKAD
ncbi:amidohydrolase [Clostridium thermobutyricum]|uniref:N-substituted formamide deformylase n=1 Tax=Clostridium thermobutyricum DSM 4928 TaxID=1121339 RepID=A0A1V4STX7_9CLOT|nr:amidohydrolase [Clostridium thermobutyricum]OPX47346.1 N-substituted formamide deformylase precursor [Clostridium thermobutyricum DSM 4928]